MKKSVFILVILVAGLIACERSSRELGGGPTEDAPEYAAKAEITKTAGPATIEHVMPGYKGDVIDGKALYVKNCSACHQLTGQGIPGAFPPLDGSKYVLENPERMASIMVYGLQGPITVKGVEYNSVMAPLGNQMSDEELAAVATYVRTSWSNKADAVDAGLFSEVRKKYGSRGMFTIEELGG